MCAVVTIFGKTDRDAHLQLDDDDTIQKVVFQRPGSFCTGTTNHVAPKSIKGWAIRHIIDWETIRRYYKKTLTDEDVDFAEPFLSEQIDDFRRNVYAPRHVQISIDWSYKGPQWAHTDRFQRLKDNCEILTLLAYNDPDNLYYGPSSSNSSDGSIAEHQKNALKAMYAGQAQVQDFSSFIKPSAHRQEIESKRDDLGRKPSLFFGKTEGDRKTYMWENVQRRLDLALGTGVTLPAEQCCRAVRRFEQMVPVAWNYDSKPGKYADDEVRIRVRLRARFATVLRARGKTTQVVANEILAPTALGPERQRLAQELTDWIDGKAWQRPGEIPGPLAQRLDLWLKTGS